MNKVYVEQDTFIETLNDFLVTQKDYCVFLIGLTGIGKSTNLKYFFGFEEQRPLVLNKTLVLPILCNSAFLKGVDIVKKVADMVETVCDFIQDEKNITFSQEKLYEFIKMNKPEVLSRARKHPQFQKAENINWLYEDFKFEYSTELLKLYLLSTDVENFVIAIDDLDSIHDWTILVGLIHQACQVWECLKNNRGKKYNVKLIIAERPETHRILCNKINWFSAYIWGEPIYLNTIPDLHKLFKKRFDCITEKLGGPKADNIEKWNIAYETLIKICTKLSIKHHDLITALNNANVRDSLSTIEQILSIGRWLERKPSDEYYFETTDQEFIDNIDLITTLRAIAYQDRRVYIDHDESRIANILYNDKDHLSDLIGPYIIKYFVENEPKETRKTRSININNLYDSVTLIFLFDNRIRERFRKTIEYFIARKLVFISPHDTGDLSLLYISPRGRMLWGLFEQNSILLDLYRDDIWIDENIFDLEKTLTLNVHDRFIEELNIIQIYADREINVLENLSTNEAKRNFLECFGTKSIAENISQGLFESIRKYYGNNRPEVISDKFTETIGIVEKVKTTIGKLI